MSEGNGKAKGLRAADLFNARRPAPAAVELPGMGTVYVRSITAGQRDRWEMRATKEREQAGKGGRHSEKPALTRALLVALACCDEEGKPLFTEDDAEQLSEQPAEVIDRIFTAAARLNRVGAGDEEEAEKNSASARS